MKLLLALAMAVSTLGPAPENRLTLEVEKTGLMKGKKHLFVFSRYHGVLSPEKVDVVIEAASIECQDKWVGAKDLKKIQEWAVKEMLAVEQYPEIRFVGTKIGPESVEGELKIRDKTHLVTVNYVSKNGVFEGFSTIKMTDFGLKPPTAALGAIGTKDDMTFRFTIKQ